eukprot:TRINITY_DN151_c0_g2_i3.p2 TRINITY_DN151_c0_g2~~TRINITY_DN151_c0_g2_i3.p2  ORF type:complete len:169 (-),score=49.96 TRINITY_DN151_c0_g2_i3:232-738(-)
MRKAFVTLAIVCVALVCLSEGLSLGRGFSDEETRKLKEYESRINIAKNRRTHAIKKIQVLTRKLGPVMKKQEKRMQKEKEKYHKMKEQFNSDKAVLDKFRDTRDMLDGTIQKYEKMIMQIKDEAQKHDALDISPSPEPELNEPEAPANTRDASSGSSSSSDSGFQLWL